MNNKNPKINVKLIYITWIVSRIFKENVHINKLKKMILNFILMIKNNIN
jgi:hypothetical protein